jgi:hypothetical protein
MNEKADRLLARHEEALEKGGADMWRNLVADTVMMMLDDGVEISRTTIEDRLEQLRTDSDSRMVRAQCRGAINVLNGRAPRD